jgi:hypothetical protein
VRPQDPKYILPTRFPGLATLLTSEQWGPKLEPKWEPKLEPKWEPKQKTKGEPKGDPNGKPKGV